MKIRAIQTCWNAVMPWIVGASFAACNADPSGCHLCEAGSSSGDQNMGGILLGNGSVCTTGTDCSSSFCVDGVCCASECTGTCQACTAVKKGSGHEGACGPIAAATDPDSECVSSACNGLGSCGPMGMSPNGAVCASASECMSEHCVDGVCCDTACTATCMACTAAKKGAGNNGVCSVIADTTDPDDECSFANCNGLGACGAPILLGNGSACSLAGECSSGFCADGVCCDVACTTTCMACTAAKKGAGNNGVCSVIADTTDPDNECNPGECNGMGACIVLNGPPCNNSQCCGLPVPADIGTAQGLIDFGHFMVLKRLIQSGDRVLSHGYGERWILWDTTTHMAVASGQSYSSGYAGMAGNLVVIQTATGLDLRSAATGQLQAAASGVPSSFAQIGIADDGSYAWAALAGGGLKAWSAQGAVVLDVMGDYAGASIFAAPTEIRVAKGPAGVNRIETLSIGGGQPNLSPTFSQSFHSWMVDGERFFAAVGNAVSIYSKNAALVASAVLPTIELLGGTGNRFWTFQGNTPGYPLRIYDTGSGGTPVVTYNYDTFTELFPSKQGIGVIPSSATEIHFIHMDTLATQEVIPIPFDDSTHLAVDGITGFWTVSNSRGVIYQQGTSQNSQAQGTLGCGAVLDIAGTPTGWAAIALASKQVLILDMNAGGVVEKVLHMFAEKVEISNNGSVLAASTRYPKQVGVFSVPVGNQIHKFTDSYDFSFSRNGERIGLTSDPVKTRQVTNVGGTLTFFGDNWSILPPPLPSPNGANIAAPDGAHSPSMGTNLYLANPMGGTPTFINAVPGAVIGWIDDNRMLAYTVKVGPPPSSPLVYDKTFIYDTQGNVVATPPIPVKLDEFDVASASAIYSPEQRKVYDLTTGAALWTSPLASTLSNAAGNRVIMVYDGGVYFVPF